MSKQIDTLIKMLHQISANNGVYGSEEAAQRISDHITRFWAVSMKKGLLDYAAENQNDFSPIELRAIAMLAERYTTQLLE